MFSRKCPTCNKVLNYKSKDALILACKNNSECRSCSKKGKNNSRFNISLLNDWKIKYGEEIANKKFSEYKKKMSDSAKRGTDHHQFGKPSSIHGGNGLKGWYNGYFFRSSYELSYLVYLIKNNIKFESGEKKIHSIEYYFENKKRNYFPDFYLPESEEYIEIKPSSLLNNKMNKAKFKKAEEIFRDKFKIITEREFKMLTKNEINKLKNLKLLKKGR